MHVKKVGGVCTIFKFYQKNETQRRHSITLYSPVVRMSNKIIKDNHFVSLKRMKTTENAANSNCFTNKMTPVFNGRRFTDVLQTLNLSDENEIFRRYITMIELYNALKFITLLFCIQKILTFNLGVAFLSP